MFSLWFRLQARTHEAVSPQPKAARKIRKTNK